MHFFFTSINLGSLPQNKALFTSDPLIKFAIFEWKCVLTISFIGNGGYHLEDETMLSILAPRLASGVAKERRRDAVNA